MDRLDKIFNFEIKEADNDNSIVAIGSKEVTDRDGDIIKVAGIALKNYKKNPVVLYGHDARALPVGKTLDVWKDGDKLMFKIQFATDEEYPFANTVYKLIKGGYINAFSIGLIPDYKAIDFNPKDTDARRIIKKSELVEISVVPLPANQDALVYSKALEDGIISKEEIENINSHELEESETQEDIDVLSTLKEINDKIDRFEDEMLKLRSGYEEFQNKMESLIVKHVSQAQNINSNDVYTKLFDVLQASRQKANSSANVTTEDKLKRISELIK